jgi:hypothetical protein
MEGRVDVAELAWRPLNQLGPRHYMVLIKEGLLCLFRADYGRAHDYLYLGVNNNRTNPSLNLHLWRIINSIESRVSGSLH